MKHIKSIAVIGLGSVGGNYMTLIADKCPDIAISAIADGARAEKLRTEGIYYNDKQYIFNVTAPKDGRPADLLFVAVKTTQLEEAAEAAKKFVGDDTIIIAPLNGVTSEKILSEKFGADKVLYSFVMKLDAPKEGNVIHGTNRGNLSFGDIKNEEGHYSENTLAVEELCKAAGIDYKIPADMKKGLWKKFMMNVAGNQTSAILDFPYGQMHASIDALALMRGAMHEAVKAAACEGVTITEEEIDKAMASFMKHSPKGQTSMLQDVRAKRRTEVESFAGTVVKYAAEYNFDAPINALYLRLIRAKEQGYGK